MGKEGALSQPLLAHGGLWGLQAGLALSGDWGGSWQGPRKGGQWALVFAELSPSKTLQSPDKYDLIPPEGSRMRADTSPESDPPIPFYRWEHQVTGEKKARGHRGSGPRTRPECLLSWVRSPPGDPEQHGLDR